MSKKIYTITLIILIVLLSASLVYSILLQNYENFIPVITTILTFLIPLIIEKIFKIKIPYHIKTFYIIYIFLSKFLGGDNYYFSTIPVYDKVIHSVYGILSCFVSIYILVCFTPNKTNNILFTIIFSISISLGTSVIWEFLEFFADNITFGNNQRLETGITDTMLDLIFTFASTNIISIFYYIEYKFKKKWLITSFINSLK